MAIVILVLNNTLLLLKQSFAPFGILGCGGILLLLRVVTSLSRLFGPSCSPALLQAVLPSLDQAVFRSFRHSLVAVEVHFNSDFGTIPSFR